MEMEIKDQTIEQLLPPLRGAKLERQQSEAVQQRKNTSTMNAQLKQRPQDLFSERDTPDLLMDNLAANVKSKASRLNSQTIEAAEQSGSIRIPDVGS